MLNFDRSLHEIYQLYPNLKFCGEPRNAILGISDDLLNYVLSILKADPILTPGVPITKWSELLSILNSHWILPLLYWHVARLPDEFRPPGPVLDRMRKAFQWSRSRCFQLETQLEEILSAFTDKGIRVLVMKGPAIGKMVYPDPALRPASDLDLLVLPDQVTRSRTILGDLGYQCLGKRFEVSRDFYNDEIFVNQKNQKHNRQVELHWDLHRFSGIERDGGVADLVDRAAEVNAELFAFEALDPIDALIHRAVSNAFDKGTHMRMIWVYDVKLLAEHLATPDDWRALQERSVAWRARLAVEHSLNMAQAWAGLELPDGFEEFSTWPEPTETEVKAWSKITEKQPGLSGLLGLHMDNASSRLDKIRYYFHLLFPSPNYIRSSYPPAKEWLLPISYVRRWWRWIKNPVS
ncbi:MAG TPA: hypothetical protein ENI07_25095 [Desulfobacterales bacterium]|nr:hypothetical protein [Desulfobacterales bacterium]